MYPRTEYEMTEEDLKMLLDACKPTPAMFLSGGVPMGGTPQQNANRAWVALGEKMGFDSETVQPINGKGRRYFSAVPSVPVEVRREWLKREAEEKRQNEIATLTAEIAEREQRLAALQQASVEAA